MKEMRKALSILVEVYSFVIFNFGVGAARKDPHQRQNCGEGED
jgi:hypothetical protein